MTEASFTFRVDDGLKSAFADAARAHDRTGAQLLRDFMRDYVRRQQTDADHDRWFHQQVEAGRASADAGRLIPAADIEARFAARRDETRQRLTGSE